MKVFLSFSGEASRKIALGLREWLPKVIQAVKPFISEDIGKGERWSEELAMELNDANFGIICITKFNSCVPWLNFEAGAVSKAIPNAIHEQSVIPLLFKTDTSEISDPLRQFQTANADKEGIFKMLVSLNNRLGEEQLTNDLLEEEFKKWWPDLESTLNKLTVEPPLPPPLPWLYTADRLTNRQKEINIKQIWVITPNLYQRTIDPKVRDVIQRNIEHNVSYTFVTISSTKTAEAERDLIRVINAKPDALKVIKSSEGTIRRLAITDYIIINPDPDAKHHLHVFLELPIESRGYWIEVDNNAALDLVNRFRQLVEGKSGLDSRSRGKK